MSKVLLIRRQMHSIKGRAHIYFGKLNLVGFILRVEAKCHQCEHPRHHILVLGQLMSWQPILAHKGESSASISGPETFGKVVMIFFTRISGSSEISKHQQ